MSISFDDLIPQQQQQQPRGMFDDLIPKKETPATGDAIKSLGTGVVEGVAGLAALPATVNEAFRGGMEWLSDKAGDALGLKKLPPEVTAKLRSAPTVGGVQLPMPPNYDTIKGAIERNVTGELYQPQTTAGEYARTIGQFAPGMMFPAAGTSSMVGRAMQNVVAPALASETAGQLTEGTSLEPYARFGGAVVGSYIPGAIASAKTPFPAAPERAKHVQTLQNEGVTALTAGQKTGSKPLQWAESVAQDTPFAGKRAANLAEAQAEQFTSAVLRRIGENAPRATPEVMDRAFTRIGQTFDDLAASTYVPVRHRLVDTAKKIADNYEQTVSAAGKVPLVGKIAEDLAAIQSTANPMLTGKQYKVWRSQIDAAARGQRDATTAMALRDLRELLDGSVRQALKGPARNEWQRARTQYRNLLVVERAAAGAGENAAQGLLSPAAVRNAVQQQSRRAYVRGQGDFADLARAGEAVLRPLPNSGTAPRQAVSGLMQLGGIGLGSLAGGGLAGASGAIAGLAAPPLLARGLMHPLTQAYLANQSAAGARNALTGRNAIIASSPGMVTAYQEAERKRKAKDRGERGR